MDGSWKIGVKVVLDHNHEINREQFTSIQVGKKVTDKEVELVELLSNAKAPPRKIAEVLSQNSGMTVSYTHQTLQTNREE